MLSCQGVKNYLKALFGSLVDCCLLVPERATMKCGNNQEFKEFFRLANRKREYELVLAVTPVANESEAAAIVESVSGYIAGQGGELSEQQTWGIRRLSFPINKFQEGNYVRALVSLEASSVAGLERTLKANEEILVHMVSRI